jgi:ABC-type spermidine/putrescine transport system permease subunit II
MRLSFFKLPPLRWGTLPAELLILAFLGVFLVYPLVYVIPGSASEEAWDVLLLQMPSPTDLESVGQTRRLLRQLEPDAGTILVKLPKTLKTFPIEAPARALAEKFGEAGAITRVDRRRVWTDFYFRQALGFGFAGSEGFPYFTVVPNNPFLWECLLNSLFIAVATTLATTVVCIPLARWFTRYRFAGRTALSTLLLVPLLLPPFVGAIGMERLLGRFGSLNLWLMDLGLVDPGQPIDWLGGGGGWLTTWNVEGLIGVVIMQVLHLYPILYLNLAAAWANLDPALEDAARNLGAGESRIFRTITFPLLLPGYFAGATLVFVWSFTDLGTPLVFGVNSVIPVQIYNQVSDPRRTNATAYALVVLTLVVTALLFYLARWAVSRGSYVGGGKGAVASAPPQAGKGRTLLIHAVVLGLTILAVLPTVGVFLTAFAERWAMTPLPEAYSAEALREVWTNKIAAYQHVLRSDPRRRPGLADHASADVADQHPRRPGDAAASVAGPRVGLRLSDLLQ